MSDRLPKVVESDRKLQELIENQNWYVQEKQRYEVAKKNVFIPADARTVFSIYMGRSYYIWVAGDSLLFFPLPPNSKPAGSDAPRAEYYLNRCLWKISFISAVRRLPHPLQERPVTSPDGCM